MDIILETLFNWIGIVEDKGLF